MFYYEWKDIEWIHEYKLFRYDASVENPNLEEADKFERNYPQNLPIPPYIVVSECPKFSEFSTYFINYALSENPSIEETIEILDSLKNAYPDAIVRIDDITLEDACNMIVSVTI